MRKTKIICTLGPSTNTPEKMKELMISGMNVARFNFSHGSYEEHSERLSHIRKLRQELSLPVAVLLDTKGPEIRIGTFQNHKIHLSKGDTFTLTTRDIIGDQNQVSVTWKELPKDVSTESRILIDDGLLELSVIEIKSTDIICKVMNDADISDRKGVNLPGISLSMPFLNDKDKEDILFGIKNDFDFIAASFTRTAEDILQMRSFIRNHGCKSIKIIAKIENMQGVENIEQILEVADGIMIARGDMGIEIPLEEVPIIQKDLISKCRAKGKPVITATQMLDSMMKHPRPTRAEATDIANAIYDGTSAIMLSGETAAGDYPIESLITMVKIAERTEQSIDYVKCFKEKSNDSYPSVTDAISFATCNTAHDLQARAIITVTKLGQTARMISRVRPACPIIGCSPDEKVCRQLNLNWGISPVLINEEKNAEALFMDAIQATKDSGYVDSNDLAVITAGVPLGISGNTNMIRVVVVN